MATFKGYLFKATKTNTVFPSRFIKLETWSSTPKQIEYLKAVRDDNTRDLVKVATSGKKSAFKFSTNTMTLADRETLNAFFTANQSNSEGDIALEYWDDKSLVYRTGNFYRPNQNFKIKKITDNGILYDSLDFEFIEI